MKKIISLILSLIIVSSIFVSVSAVEEVTISDGTTVVEDVSPELCELSMYCNGNESKIITIPFKSEFYSKNYYEQSYQYITVANSLGYTTKYNDETQEIISERADRTIKMTVGSNDAQVINNDTPKYVYLYDCPFVVNGRTFVSMYDMKKIFDIEVYVSDYDEENANDIPYVNIYEYKHIKEIFKTEFAGYKNIIEMVCHIPQDNWQSNVLLEYKIDFNSDTFGTSVKGRGKTNLTLENGENYEYIKVSNNSDGIFNLLELRMNLYDWALFDDNNREHIINLDETADMELYLNDENIYIKSEELTNAKNKWLKVPNLSVETDFDVYNDNLSEMIKDYAINGIVSQFVDNNSYMSYAEICKRISDFKKLFDEKKINYNEKTKTLKINCTAQDFQNIAMFLGVSDEYTQWFGLNISGTDVFDNKGFSKGNGTVKYSLKNIPNPYNIEIGTVSFEMKITTETKALIKERSLPDPANIIEKDELNLETI